MTQENIIVIIDVKKSQLLTNEIAGGENNDLAIIYDIKRPVQPTPT